MYYELVYASVCEKKKNSISYLHLLHIYIHYTIQSNWILNCEFSYIYTNSSNKFTDGMIPPLSIIYSNMNDERRSYEYDANWFC